MRTRLPKLWLRFFQQQSNYYRTACTAATAAALRAARLDTRCY